MTNPAPIPIIPNEHGSGTEVAVNDPEYVLVTLPALVSIASTVSYGILNWEVSTICRGSVSFVRRLTARPSAVMVADEFPPLPFRKVTAEPAGVQVAPAPPVVQLPVPTPAKTSVSRNSISGEAGLPPFGLKVRNTTDGLNTVPIGSLALDRLVSNPSPSYVAKSPVPEAGVFQGPGFGDVQGPGEAQKFKKLAPMVKVPPKTSVPFTGLADAVWIMKSKPSPPAMATVLEKYFIFNLPPCVDSEWSVEHS